ncbi:MAG: dipeptide ABC transporter ATP-binding protein DppD, partial [Rhodoferax sp.]|nr:dipeptide ABC transporter ATP-binding protein DppD [Rhodoferax sp.]
RCQYANAHCRSERPVLRDWQDGRVCCHTPMATDPVVTEVLA